MVWLVTAVRFDAVLSFYFLPTHRFRNRWGYGGIQRTKDMVKRTGYGIQFWDSLVGRSTEARQAGLILQQGSLKIILVCDVDDEYKTARMKVAIDRIGFPSPECVVLGCDGDMYLVKKKERKRKKCNGLATDSRILATWQHAYYGIHIHSQNNRSDVRQVGKAHHDTWVLFSIVIMGRAERCTYTRESIISRVQLRVKGAWHVKGEMSLRCSVRS